MSNPVKPEEYAVKYEELNKNIQFSSGKEMLDKFLFPHFPCSASIRILDLGCGTGTLAKLISEKYKNATIDACDPSQERINVAEKCNSAKQISYFCSDGTKFLTSAGHKYDAIYSNFVLHWIKDKGALFDAIHNSLTPSGVSFHLTLDKQEASFLSILTDEKEKEKCQRSFHLLSKDEWEVLVEKADLKLVDFVQKSSLSHKVPYESVDVLLDMLDSLKDLTGVSSFRRSYEDHPDKEALHTTIGVQEDGSVVAQFRTLILLSVSRQKTL